jgi:hypothetical protein
MRVKELALLHLADWHVDAEVPHVVVRFGSLKRGRLGPPKNGRKRTIMLLGPALEAAREWTDVHLPKLPNGAGASALVFPSRSGGFRKDRFLSGCSVRKGVRKYRWQQLLEAADLADVQPTIVWHSFRHTCATALLSGQWGHKWAPEEVMRQLGHTDIATTMGYAKIVEERLAELAKITTGSRGFGGGGGSLRNHDEIAKIADHVAAQHLLLSDRERVRALRGARDRAVIAAANGDAEPMRELLTMVVALASSALWSPHMVTIGLAMLDELQSVAAKAEASAKAGGAS